MEVGINPKWTDAGVAADGWRTPSIGTVVILSPHPLPVESCNREEQTKDGMKSSFSNCQSVRVPRVPRVPSLSASGGAPMLAPC